MMKLRFPNIKLIENKENLGFPKGNNIAVKEAKGEFICILNPDTVVSEDTFEAVPPTWKVRSVNCVPGSPIDWAAITPTASPF
jgi:GT2 family glycosyltransferase